MQSLVKMPTVAKVNGVGVGLRSAYFGELLAGTAVPWLEVLADQFMVSEGCLKETLQALRRNYPMTLHSVGLSLGSIDPINSEYVKQLKALATVVQPAWISDHLAWVSCQGEYVYDLLPLPHTPIVATYVAQRIRQVQDEVGYPFLLENISSYLTYRHSTLSEAQFLESVAEQANCGILLDVNNLYVNSMNHGMDVDDYLNTLDPARIKQLHLAGYTEENHVLIDTHSKPIYPAVWALYQKVLDKFGPVPALIEWDSDLPAWDVLEQERVKAEGIML